MIDMELDKFDPVLMLERELERSQLLVKDMIASLNAPVLGRGTVLSIGVDCEWVFLDGKNKVLSVQFYTMHRLYGVSDAVEYSKILYVEDGRRLSLINCLYQLVDEMLNQELFDDFPCRVDICGFFLRADLSVFSDFNVVKHHVDNVAGSASSINVSLNLGEDMPLDGISPIIEDGDGVKRILPVRFLDINRHLPEGVRLMDVGEMLNLPKLVIPDGYSIDRMDLLLKGDKQAFDEYALRDAEITVKFKGYLESLMFREFDLNSLPVTISSTAVNVFIQLADLREFDDMASVFGKKMRSIPIWDDAKKQVRTVKRIENQDLLDIFNNLATKCYHGGRNECYVCGLSPVGDYYDFDLAGAYTTGLVDLRYLDFDKIYATTNVVDFRGHTVGCAYIRFSHPEGFRYPIFPVKTEYNGLIYPLSGETYVTAPEIELALNQGVEVKMLMGVIVPWDDQKGDARVFESFVTAIRRLRASYPKGSLDELYIKLLGNGLSGKLGQGLHEKTAFDARHLDSGKVPESKITNAFMASHMTGFIRAVMTEIMLSVPEQCTVLSVTTDGFLTDANLDELDLTGSLASRFNALCQRVAPDKPMLEQKHHVKQVIAMKTRGQLTALAGEGAVLLAKAGVSPPVPKSEHNAYMVDLYLNRSFDSKSTIKPFTSFRSQWMNDSDVVREDREVKISLEYDMKRELYGHTVNYIASDTAEPSHIYLRSRAWKTIDDFQNNRVLFDEWRRGHTLKAVSDWEGWQSRRHVKTVNDRLKAEGHSRSRVGADGFVGVLKRQFLIAYTQQLHGVYADKKPFTYKALADWLSAEGFTTTASDVKNAKRGIFVPNLVLKTGEVVGFADVITRQFPNLDMGQFFADMD